MPSTISTFVDRFRYSLDCRDDVEHTGQRGGVVWWITRQDDWVRPCWVGVSRHLRGLIRIQNRTGVFLPRRVWPLAMPSRGGCRAVELTFDKSELTDAIHELISRVAPCLSIRLPRPYLRSLGKSRRMPGL